MPDNEENKSGMAVALLTRLFVGLAFAPVILFLGAMLAASGILPETSISVWPAVAGFAGALWCGRGAARTLGSKALLIGFVSGVAYFFALFFLGAVFYLRWAPGVSTTSMMLACLIGGLMGGLLAVTRGKASRDKPRMSSRRTS